jgi:hypothetical protein
MKTEDSLISGTPQAIDWLLHFGPDPDFEVRQSLHIHGQFRLTFCFTDLKNKL